jgi:hypothetical protein
VTPAQPSPNTAKGAGGFAKFLYELASRFEASYRVCIDRYNDPLDQQRAERLCQMLFHANHAAQQLELFDELEPF